MVSGSSFVTDGWGDEVEAIVAAWYSGAEGGNALAALLFGDANFSGRLPITFAARDEDHPPFDNVSLEVEYGYFHGYRHLQHEGVAPLYPFGFGRSYTTFSYDALDVQRDGDDLVVSAEVTNTGDRSGIETIQTYIGSPDGGFARGPRDLRGFAQLELAPGASATATIRIPVERLRRFDEATSAWVLEPGDHVVEVGPNVEDLPLSESVVLP